MAGNIALTSDKAQYEQSKIAAVHDGRRKLWTGAELAERLRGLPDHLKPGEADG